MKTHSMNYSGRSIVKCSTDKESKLMFQRVERSLPPLTCQPGTISSPWLAWALFPVCSLCTLAVAPRRCSCTLGLCWKPCEESDKLAPSPTANEPGCSAPKRTWVAPQPLFHHVESIWCIRCAERNDQSQQEEQPVRISAVLSGFGDVCWPIWIQLAVNFCISAMKGKNGTWGDRFF